MAEGAKITQKTNLFPLYYSNIHQEAQLMRGVHVRGTIFSGKKNGARFIKLPWVKKQIEEKIGFAPHPGTLNMRLSEDDAAKLRDILKKAKPVYIKPMEGFCRGRCFKAQLINEHECAIIIPDIIEYPENVIEIVAPEDLRRKLQLEDNDTIDVRILLE